MLATLTDAAFDSSEWVFEVKWDGYRAIATVQDGDVHLESRNNLSFNKKFAAVAKALESLKHNVVLDGEVVVLDDHGRPSFQMLQSYEKNPFGEIVYYVFDVLWIDGVDVTEQTLLERKALLKDLLPKNDIVRYSDHIDEQGVAFYEAAEAHKLEGIMAKRADSTYAIGYRSKNWLKIKTHKRQEAVIAGYTAARGSRSHFGALILGMYKDGKLVYIGHTGTGFDRELLVDIHKRLQPLRVAKSPFAEVPKTNQPATWVKPKLIAEIKFQEWTADGHMRQPVFIGLRDDKSPKEVTKEKVMPAKMNKTVAKQALAKNATSTKAVLTNLDKLYWKKEKITKGDVISYYDAIAPYMLPYMKDRPQSLNRTPDGVAGMNFYQKDMTGKVPDWITLHPSFSESNKETIKYMVCTGKDSLLYMANLGCIEMNPWHSRTKKPDNPDYCVIDLDPHEIGFDKVVATAIVVNKVLASLGIQGYPKTSGATGLHIYIPLGSKYSYEQSKALAHLIVTLVHSEVPSFTSLERSPAKRRRKVYLDYLQNRESQTLACVYSLRPKPGATVSTPLHWDEVNKGLSPSQFTITSIFDRLDDIGDIFGAVLKKGISINTVLKRAEAISQ